jgi:hypothetical protein
MRLSEEVGIVYGYKPADHNAAGIKADSIDTSICTHVTYILQFGSLTGNSVLTVNSGASDGTETTAETFYYRLAGADQAATGADIYAAETAATTLTLTAATYDNKILIVEVPVAELTEGQPFLTLDVNDTATALFTSCVAILSGMRYKAASVPSAIA